jgi:uncharacterized membrane protein
MRKHILPLTLIVLMAAAWIAALPHLPAEVPIHWDFNGRADGFASPFMAMLTSVGIMVLLYVSMAFLPKIDPRKKNYQYFFKSYQLVLNVLLAVLFLLNLMVILNGVGYSVPIAGMAPVIVGVIFMVLGNYLPQIRSNFFIGVRTPWTLSNEKVWKKTHRLTAKLFFFGGLAMMATILLPEATGNVILMVIIAITVMIPYVYSYLIFRKEGSGAV